MEALPTDILENILSRLRNKSILQCKRVCRTFRTIVGNNNNVGLLFTFKKTHWKSTGGHVIQLYYGDPRYETKTEKYYSKKTLTSVLVPRVVSLEPYDTVGSCNGLVCYEAWDPLYYGRCHGLAFICNNPITGEVAYIPGLEKHEQSLSEGPSWRPPVGGFGYVGTTNEYKVVRIYFRYRKAYIQVYTLGSHLGWRDIRNVPDRFSADKSGIFANGALHWINLYECNQMILAFGLACEEFWHMPSPPVNQNSNEDRHNSKLIQLGGNLCVAHTDHKFINKCLDIWVFKKKVTNSSRTMYNEEKEKQPYDHTWSWSKEYSIAWEGEVLYTPFVITKRNTVLMWQNGTSNLSCYDPKTSTLQKYWEVDKRSSNNNYSYVQAIPHMNSLVSFIDLGET